MKHGFLNLLKPPGMTSHDMVSAVRRCLGVRRVGHAGTLDPGAAGVLPVAVGRASRLVEYLAGCGKSYRAELVLGYATDSGDDTGTVVARREPAELPSEQALQEALKGFLGTVVQVPPKYSAVKISGKRACDLAREGIDVEIPQRQVRIERIDIAGQREDGWLIDVACSAGTYIRSLCADIGKALGIPATMGFLLRTRAGEFRLEDALTLEELESLGEDALLEPGECLGQLPRYELASSRRRAFCNGLATHGLRPGLPSGLLRVCSEGEFLGVGRFDAEEGSLSPIKVYGEANA